MNKLSIREAAEKIKKLPHGCLVAEVEELIEQIHNQQLIKHAVVAAVIKNEDGDRIYIQQRPEGKEFADKWELPGGKVEEDETLEQALIRELNEEIGSFFDWSVTKFISSTVKTSTMGPWKGEQYLLAFFEVNYDREMTITSKTCRNYLWIGRNQIEVLKDTLCHEDLLVLLTEGMFK